MNNNRVARQDGQNLLLVEPFQPVLAARMRTNIRRRITPEASLGLKTLAHALEYLTEEFVRDGAEVGRDYGRLQAIQLLASLSRQLYFACEVEATFTERVLSVLRRYSTVSN